MNRGGGHPRGGHPRGGHPRGGHHRNSYRHRPHRGGIRIGCCLPFVVFIGVVTALLIIL